MSGSIERRMRRVERSVLPEMAWASRACNWTAEQIEIVVAGCDVGPDLVLLGASTREALFFGVAEAATTENWVRAYAPSGAP